MNKSILLAALSAFTLTLSAQAGPVAAATLAKTNNVMTLDFTLIAWPNATATPRANALRQGAALLSAPVAGAMFMPIIGLTNDYTPDPIDLTTDDPLPTDVVDLPPDVVDILPIDGGLTDVPPDGIFIPLVAATRPSHAWRCPSERHFASRPQTL